MNFDVAMVKKTGTSLAKTAYDNTLTALNLLEEGKLLRLPASGTVLIKPNLTQPPNPTLKFGPRDSDLSVHNHVCTDPFAVKAAVDFFSQRDCAVYVGEGTKWPGGTKAAYLHMGYEAVLEDTGAILLDLLTETDDERITLTPSKAYSEEFASFQVNRFLEEVDVLVNIAKLKSHSNMLITGALKNLWGLLEPSPRRAAGHNCADPLWNEVTRGEMAYGYKKLTEGIVQVHEGIVKNLKQVCIIEGIISGEGDGPLFQPATPRREDIVIAGISPASVDAAETRYMGYTPEYLGTQAEDLFKAEGAVPTPELLESYSTPYQLKLAEEMGLGTINSFNTLIRTQETSNTIPVENIEQYRSGATFKLPTFARQLCHTPLYEQIPHPGTKFKIEE